MCNVTKSRLLETFLLYFLIFKDFYLSSLLHLAFEAFELTFTKPMKVLTRGRSHLITK